MYITYVSGQQAAEPTDPNNWLKAIGGSFRPTCLIRTSDWTKVAGSEATKGYCAVSYSWDQSGHLVERIDGELDCIDNGRHKLVVRKQYSKLSILRRRTKAVEYLVLYEDILKQICKDFGIDYLWYDKLCINQTNKKEKVSEIEQMHKIYSNARYTVAIVPEIAIKDSSEFECRDAVYHLTKARSTATDAIWQSHWWTRSWTLEELMMSKQILLVGSNTHLWMQSVVDKRTPVSTLDFITSMLDFNNTEIKSVNQVLKHAHFRTSSKEHDKIFALKNILHGVISINFNYDSNIQSVCSKFYRMVAERDLSIMCFGSDINLRAELTNTMGSYNLPSWTGVFGLHTHYPVVTTLFPKNLPTVDHQMRLHIRAKYHVIHPQRFKIDWSYLHKKGMSQGEHRLSEVIEGSNDPGTVNRLRWEMYHSSHCVATHYWITDHGAFFPTTVLSLTENCDECVILSMVFHSTSLITRRKKPMGYQLDEKHTYFLPVLKPCKTSGTYKSVGVIFFKNYYISQTLDDPLHLLDNTFSSTCDMAKEFIIE